MTETELRAIPPFDTFSVETADSLCRPTGPKFTGTIYEADDVLQVRDFLCDRQLLPKGAYRGGSGKLRAVFWQLR